MTNTIPGPGRELPSSVDALLDSALPAGSDDLYWLQSSPDYANAAIADLLVVEDKYSSLRDGSGFIPTIQDVVALQRTTHMIKEVVARSTPEISVYRVELSEAIGSLALGQTGDVVRTVPRPRRWEWSEPDDRLLASWEEETAPVSAPMVLESRAVEAARSAVLPETWLLTGGVKSFLEHGPSSADDDQYAHESFGSFGKATNDALLELVKKQGTDDDLAAVKALVDKFGVFLPGIDRYMFRPQALFELLSTPIQGDDGTPDQGDTLASRLLALHGWAESQAATGNGTASGANLDRPWQSKERIPFGRRKAYVADSRDDIRAYDLEDTANKVERSVDWANRRAVGALVTAYQSIFYEVIRGVRYSDLNIGNVSLNPMGNKEQRIGWGLARRIGKALVNSERRITGWTLETGGESKRVVGWIEALLAAGGMAFSEQTKGLHAAMSGYDDYPLLMSRRGPEDTRTQEERARSFVTQLILGFGFDWGWFKNNQRPMKLVNRLGRRVLRKQFDSLEPEAQDLVIALFANRLTAARERWIDDQRERLGLPRFDKLEAQAEPS